jgi:GNAT superfamily N-acetyltransferase
MKQLVELWNIEMGLHFPMREELFQQNSIEEQNVYIPGSFIAVDQDDQVAGFVIAKRWQENLDIQMNKDVGWIQVLMVGASFRSKGIGSALLKLAEKALRDSQCKKVFLGRDTWHYFPGVPTIYKEAGEWFERHGYHPEGIEADLIQHFNEDSRQLMPSLEKVEFSLIQQEEKQELLSFLNRCFPGRWEYEAIHYFNRGGTGREFVVLRKAGQIIGFCRMNDYESPFIAQNVYWSPLFKQPLGGIGPLGIDRNERKKGYGLAIVEAAISILRDRKINSIVIDWTGLVNFYGLLGFTVWKEYQQYSKDL